MMRSMKWLSATAAISSLAALSIGCAAGGADDDETEVVGEAQQAQLDPGLKDYAIYTVRDSGVTVGRVLVTRTSSSLGYAADREYWYMTANLSNSSTVTFVSRSSEYWSNPPSGLGTLSFVTERRPTWTSSTPSGTFPLYTDSYTGERIGMDWQMNVSHGNWWGSITWWHSNTDDIFGPGPSTTLSPGTPAAGTWYQFTTPPL